MSLASQGGCTLLARGGRVALALGVFLALASTLSWGQVADPRVTEANIRTTICRPGYTATVRPSNAEMARVKHRLMDEAGLPWSTRFNYELDHVLPLEIGGHPRDPGNLRLQAYPEATEKDKVETALHRMICVRPQKISLAKARACFTTGSWRDC